ncbi:hypothetical protein KBC79_04345 [Candidatus Woesebacteria bacterium]|nr:hypothetical protein [Candidatus Woesebacteria bacterium]
MTAEVSPWQRLVNEKARFFDMKEKGINTGALVDAVRKALGLSNGAEGSVSQTQKVSEETQSKE